MTVRSHLPWPLRWAAAALVLGFSAALALWAFQFGKEIAGLERNAKEELVELRAELARLRSENERVGAVANTAESLLRTERAAQESLARAVRQLEEEARSLRADLGFFERLLPSTGSGLQVRGFKAEARAPGQLRYQMLLMQSGKPAPEFAGRYEVLASGSMSGKSWSLAMPGGAREVKLREYVRVEGLIDHPPEAVVKSLQVRVLDEKGSLKASQSVSL